MELLTTILRLSAGAEILGAVVTGRTTRLALSAMTFVVALLLPVLWDPVLAIVEIVVIRRLG